MRKIVQTGSKTTNLLNQSHETRLRAEVNTINWFNMDQTFISDQG